MFHTEHIVPQKYTEAKPYVEDVLIGSPAEVRDHFHWADHLIKRGDFISKYLKFTDTAKIPLDIAQLNDACFKSFTFCGKVYHDILFPPGSPQLPYHDLNHGLITSVTAQKMFLGGLDLESKAGRITLPPTDNFVKLHHLFSLVSSLHEIDDWWDRPYPGTKGQHNPHIAKAKSDIAQHLRECGLSTHDFNRLLVLDDFREEQEASLEKSLKLKRNEGFLRDNKIPSLLDQFTMAERETIFKIASKALCASDFLQVINPAYLQPVILVFDDKKISFSGLAGPYVLALEMQQWRKNALEMAGFGRSDGTIYWKMVNISLEFFENVAFPRIKSGLDYLKAFNLEEYVHANQVIEDKLKLLREQATPNPTA